LVKWSEERQERHKTQSTKEGRKVLKLKRFLQMNVAREWRVAQEGRVLEKVTQKYGSSERRMVRAEWDGKAAVLTWDHPGGRTLHSAKTADLSTIIRLDWGYASGRATLLFPNAQPWLCFSLITVERSYDFICPDEYVVQCFVLALSRLCQVATGSPVPGGPRSRSQFMAMKGWCKVEYGCIKSKKSIPQAVLEAARKVGKVVSSKPRKEETGRRGGVVRTASMDLGHEHNYDSDGDGKAVGRASVMGSGDVAQDVQFCRSFTIKKEKQQDAAKVAKLELTSASGAHNREWPNKGETWIFTGAVREVDVYKAGDALEWANQIKCRDKDNERREVIIEETAEAGQQLISIRGTGKMRFVSGWIKIVDDRGAWVVEKKL